MNSAVIGFVRPANLSNSSRGCRFHKGKAWNLYLKIEELNDSDGYKRMMPVPVHEQIVNGG